MRVHTTHPDEFSITETTSAKDESEEKKQATAAPFMASEAIITKELFACKFAHFYTAANIR